jgi:hypothetical protein
MTSAAVVMAMLPLAMKLGEGSEVYAPLAVTVIGGMITSTVLTLGLIPTVYTLFDDLSGLITSLPRLIGRLTRALATKREVVLAASIPLALIAACAPVAPAAPAAPTPQQASIEATRMPVPGINPAPPGRLEIFSWWTTGGEAAGLNALLALYHRQNPGVKIVNATVAGGGGSNAKAALKTRMLGNDPPDSFQVHMGHELTDAWVVSDKMEPLDSIYTEMGFDSAEPGARRGRQRSLGHGDHRRDELVRGPARRRRDASRAATSLRGRQSMPMRK